MLFRTPPLPSSRVRWLPSLLLAGITFQAAAQNMTVYTDSLQNSWNNWSYFVTVDVNSAAVVHSGTKAIAVSLVNATNAYGALSLEHANIDSSPYTNLTFWINGGPTGGQQLQVYAELATGGKPAIGLPALQANTWQQITLSLASLGVANQPNFSRFSIQNVSGNSNMPVFYVDDIILTTNGTPPPPPVTNISVTVSVDAQSNQHAISPLIYGTAFAGSSGQLSDLNAPIHRSGGNAETRYNWTIDAHNRGADYFFESIGDNGGTVPGAYGDGFVSESKAGGAEPMLSIPMIGWACKLGPGRAKLPSFSIAKYGPQQQVDQYDSDAGNGVASPSGTNIVNDPTDADYLTNSTMALGWVQHLTNTWGPSTNGGVRYYLMDNEHSIWFATHRDIHPVGPTMQEIRDRIFDYAGVVKSVDPGALVGAPEEWGWGGYFYSGYDQQNPGQLDRGTNGNMDYCPWLLQQLHQHDIGTGQRLLDYFTLHCYPQGGESGTNVSQSTQILRNQSTRQLWDTNYVDQSWIGQQAPGYNILMLIPRMKNWVATYYPGTKIGITEYNWGAESSINGATAQADVLGIFGREGLDLATRWTTPNPGTPTYKAMKIYRNYDGNDSTFGDTSVSTTVSTNVDLVSAFAAARSSDGAMTVMLINKQLSASATTTLNLANYTAGTTAQVWQLTSANAITRLGDAGVSGGSLTTTVPAQSITLFVVPAGIVVPPPSPILVASSGLSSSNTFNFVLNNGVAGQRYVIQASADLVTWSSVQTNTLGSSSNSYAFPVPGTMQFYRAQWAP